MKTKIFLCALISALLGVLLVSSPALADLNYSCMAKANPNRGFKDDMRIRVVPKGVGGDLIVEIGTREKSLGKISEAATLRKANSSEKNAFMMTIQLIGEPDVSGLSPLQLSKVTTIEALRAKLPDGDEAFVYRLISGNTQIGGTFMVSGMGTACVP